MLSPRGEVVLCATSPTCPLTRDSYQASLKRAVKHGLFFSSCLHSSQRPRAQEFTFHSLGFSSRGGEAKQLKRRPGFLRACLFSPSLSLYKPPYYPPTSSSSSSFFFSVNSIHSGKGSKKHNSCAEEKWRWRRDECWFTRAHCRGWNRPSLVLWLGKERKKKKGGKEKHKTLGIKGCKTVQLRATPLLSAAASASCLLTCAVTRGQHRLHRAGASSGALWLRATRREGELIFPFTCL